MKRRGAPVNVAVALGFQLSEHRILNAKRGTPTEKGLDTSITGYHDNLITGHNDIITFRTA